MTFTTLATIAALSRSDPSAAPPAGLRTFGTGRSEFKVSTVETTVFEHSVPSGSFGVFTHFWITGAPSPGGGIDNATVRYYLDGEARPSIEFKPPLAAGVGFDDLTVWGTSKAAHGAKDGAWTLKYRIPFQRSARVTIQHPSGVDRLGRSPDPPLTCYLIVRGTENLPLPLGGVYLPGSTARLSLHKIESETFEPLAWVPLLDLSSGTGAIFQTTLAIQSGNKNFLEACYHL